MQTQLSPEFKAHAEAQRAAEVLRECVHCGFCNATCPTYQILGDERDGPRGRIYLIKQVLEGAEVTRATQQHLDRCLTCLNCESTCPSGVKYGRLVEIGRKLVDERVPRRWHERAIRWLLRWGLTSPLFAPAARLGRLLGPLLPEVVRDKLPIQTPALPYRSPSSPGTRAKGLILMLRGCVQPSLLPRVDRAAKRLLEKVGYEVIDAAGTACCGALRSHLSDPVGGLDNMRHNIDAWGPWLNDKRLCGITSSASACALALKQYGHALEYDVVYKERAARVSSLTRDLSEFLPELVPALAGSLRQHSYRCVAFHPPCTLQHGQRLRGSVEAHLRSLGLDVKTCPDAHLCCGSAGAYSLLQPQIARQLRDRKLGQLTRLEPDCLVSANVGCITHLQSGTSLPVKHWIEVLEEMTI